MSLDLEPLAGTRRVELEMIDPDGNIHKNRFTVYGPEPRAREAIRTGIAGVPLADEASPRSEEEGLQHEEEGLQHEQEGLQRAEEMIPEMEPMDRDTPVCLDSTEVPYTETDAAKVITETGKDISGERTKAWPVVLIILGAAGILLLLFFLWRKRKKKDQNSD
jgi:LPXTG-motif cell wall-anchored protein